LVNIAGLLRGREKTDLARFNLILVSTVVFWQAMVVFFATPLGIVAPMFEDNPARLYKAVTSPLVIFMFLCAAAFLIKKGMTWIIVLLLSVFLLPPLFGKFAHFFHNIGNYTRPNIMIPLMVRSNFFSAIASILPMLFSIIFLWSTARFSPPENKRAIKMSGKTWLIWLAISLVLAAISIAVLYQAGIADKRARIFANNLPMVFSALLFILTSLAINIWGWSSWRWSWRQIDLARLDFMLAGTILFWLAGFYLLLLIEKSGTHLTHQTREIVLVAVPATVAVIFWIAGYFLNNRMRPWLIALISLPLMIFVLLNINDILHHLTLRASPFDRAAIWGLICVSIVTILGLLALWTGQKTNKERGKAPPHFIYGTGFLIGIAIWFFSLVAYLQIIPMLPQYPIIPMHFNPVKLW